MFCVETWERKKYLNLKKIFVVHFVVVVVATLILLWCIGLISIDDPIACLSFLFLFLFSLFVFLFFFTFTGMFAFSICACVCVFCLYLCVYVSYVNVFVCVYLFSLSMFRMEKNNFSNFHFFVSHFLSSTQKVRDWKQSKCSIRRSMSKPMT